MWEKPAFQSDDRFDLDVIQRLHTGDGPGTKGWTESGLDEMRNNDQIEQGHLFDDMNMPRIFIMAPRQRVWTASGNDMSNSETAGGSVFAYTEYVNRITAELKKIFGNNADISTVQYSPMTKAPDLVRNPDGSVFIAVEEEENGDTEFAVVGDFIDSKYDTHRGKLLIQYQPASQACQVDVPAEDQPQAKWRVWFENQGQFSLLSSTSVD